MFNILTEMSKTKAKIITVIILMALVPAIIFIVIVNDFMEAINL